MHARRTMSRRRAVTSHAGRHHHARPAMSPPHHRGPIAAVAAAPGATTMASALNHDTAVLRLSLRRERRDRETERGDGGDRQN
jgi:hypothetical protein